MTQEHYDRFIEEAYGGEAMPGVFFDECITRVFSAYYEQ